MDTNEEHEIKKEFQLERVILFSDAVFAIIITIMVLDVRLPEGLRHADPKHVKHVLIELIPKILAYCLSFFLVAKLWLRHLKMFSLLKDYDSGLLAFNLLHLFSVSLFPFAVTLISGNVDLENIQFSWSAYTYFSIVLFTTLSQSLIARHLMRNREKLCFNTSSLDGVLKYQVMRINFFLVPAMVAAMIGLSYFDITPAYIVCIFSVYGIIMSKLFKKYYPADDHNGPVLLRLFKIGKRKTIHKGSMEIADTR